VGANLIPLRVKLNLLQASEHHCLPVMFMSRHSAELENCFMENDERVMEGMVKALPP
jgi:hypothetical protein